MLLKTLRREKVGCMRADWRNFADFAAMKNCPKLSNSLRQARQLFREVLAKPKACAIWDKVVFVRFCLSLPEFCSICAKQAFGRHEHTGAGNRAQQEHDATEGLKNPVAFA